MKKLLTVPNLLASIAIATAVMLTAGIGVVKASVDVNGSNDTTGPNSENQNTWDIDNSNSIDIQNDAKLDNDFDFDVATNLGDIECNTEVGDVSGGDVWGTIDVQNDLNGGDIAFADQNLGDINLDFTNEITGPNSENTNKAEIDNSSDLDISNHADIKNDVDLKARTGGGEVEDNTIVGDVSTGSVRFDITQNNQANTGMGDIDLTHMSGTNVTGNFSNELTGPCSENKNTLDLDNRTDLDIHNSANIDNKTKLDVSTGGNEIGHNTVVGDVSTGSVRIDMSTTNSAN